MLRIPRRCDGARLQIKERVPFPTISKFPPSLHFAWNVNDRSTKLFLNGNGKLLNETPDRIHPVVPMERAFSGQRTQVANLKIFWLSSYDSSFVDADPSLHKDFRVWAGSRESSACSSYSSTSVAGMNARLTRVATRSRTPCCSLVFWHGWLVGMGKHVATKWALS